MVDDNCLQSILLGATDQDRYTGTPEHFVQEDLQNLTSLLACAAAAAVCQDDETPPGLTSRFEAAFTQPTPGKLNEFVSWCSQRLHEERTPALRNALIEQGKGSSWLKTMATLRNLWAHPKDEPRETVLERVQEALQNLPDLIVQPRLELSETAEVFWRDDESAVALAPFVVSADNRIRSIVEFKPEIKWRFSCVDNDATKRFEEFWFDQRVRDAELREPSTEEVIAKARLSGKLLDRDDSWWVSQLWSHEAPGFLAESLPHALKEGSEGDDSRGRLALQLDFESGTTVNQKIAETLGLADPPTNEDLAVWSKGAGGMILMTKTESIRPRDLLQLLYWLADIRDRKLNESVKLVMSRPAEKLEADQQTLWDRLPDNLDTVLAPPPKSKRAGLADYLWPFEKPKRLFGIF